MKDAEELEAGRRAWHQRFSKCRNAGIRLNHCPFSYMKNSVMPTFLRKSHCRGLCIMLRSVEIGLYQIQEILTGATHGYPHVDRMRPGWLIRVFQVAQQTSMM